MILITHVHFDNGETHKHISRFKWEGTTSQKKGESTLSEMIEHIKKHPETVYTRDGENYAEILIIDDTPRYLRSQADGVLGNNLLNLPLF